MRWSETILSIVAALWASDGLAQMTTVVTIEDMQRLRVESVADIIAQSPDSVPDPITESELAMTKEAIGIGVGGGFLDFQVLSFVAWRRYADDGTYSLEGKLWQTPVFAQERICILPMHGVVGEPAASGYEWSRKLFETTFHWMADTEAECEASDPNQGMPPQFSRAVTTTEIIPTDVMIAIVEGSDRLIQAMLEHPSPSASMLRSEDRDWRLSRVSLATSLRPGIGIAYHASFIADVGYGPSITFSIVDGEFVVHGIGSWVA